MTFDIQKLATDAAYWDECGAPEWATHFDTAIDAFCNWKGYKAPKDGKYHGWGINRSWHLEEFADQFIPRPQSEWVDGLPPEGCECQVVHRHEEYVNCEVLAYRGGEVAYYVPGFNTVGLLDRRAFRPIPTKAQRDREELANVLSKAAYNLGFSLDLEESDGLAGAVIASGWTKP